MFNFPPRLCTFSLSVLRCAEPIVRLRPLAVSALFLLATTGRVAAYSSGITTDSFDAQGCNECHSGGKVPVVMLSGPTAVVPQSTNEYTLQISNPKSQGFAGLNVSATAGTLSTGGSSAAQTQTLANRFNQPEVTHTGRKPGAGGVTKFSFLWTAPATFSSATLNAWGNAVNGNKLPSGDHAAFTSLMIVAAEPPPTATPVPLTATPVPDTPTPQLVSSTDTPAESTPTPVPSTAPPTSPPTGTPTLTAMPTPTPTETPASTPIPTAPADSPPGDANCDGLVSAADPTALVILISEAAPAACSGADADGSGFVDEDDLPPTTAAIFSGSP
jgi:hypothetical protein